MRFLAPVLLALGAARAAAQQGDPSKAFEKASETRRKCAELLAGVEGARVSGLAGSGAEDRILVSCLNPEARDAAREKLGGDLFQGLRVSWTLAPLPAAAPAVPADKPAPPAPEAKPAKEAFDPEKALAGSPTDCDILRDYLKLKPVHHPLGNGRSLIPCQLVRRSVVGTWGGHTYVYTKHRDNCPIRLGRCSQPTWADNFVAWVFQKGFTPVMRAGFTWPHELRGDDKLWDAQASGELKTRLPYIREGAEWTHTPSAWEKVTRPDFSGWLTTGGHPGEGWTWSQPWNQRTSETPTGPKK
jgi:hypothetical protein